MKLRFSELEHNNRILFATIYSEVIFQFYVADLCQTKLKDKEAASSGLEAFQSMVKKTLKNSCLVKIQGMAIDLAIYLHYYSKWYPSTGK